MPGTFTRPGINTGRAAPPAPPGIQNTGDHSPVFSCNNARKPPAAAYGPFLFRYVNTLRRPETRSDGRPGAHDITICYFISPETRKIPGWPLPVFPKSTFLTFLLSLFTRAKFLQDFMQILESRVKVVGIFARKISKVAKVVKRKSDPRKS